MPPIRVKLLNGDASVLSSLTRLLELESDVDLSGREKPEVVVVHLTHPNMAVEVRRNFPDSRILARVSVMQPELRNHPLVDLTVDAVAPYDVLLASIRRLAPR
ncbi:MAG: hypothetical protein AB1758_00570 [Candidatus Eremiobacterota bacterium]